MTDDKTFYRKAIIFKYSKLAAAHKSLFSFVEKRFSSLCLIHRVTQAVNSTLPHHLERLSRLVQFCPRHLQLSRLFRPVCFSGRLQCPVCFSNVLFIDIYTVDTVLPVHIVWYHEAIAKSTTQDGGNIYLWPETSVNAFV